MEKTLKIDLTQGNVLKCILLFALPMFLGMLFQQFYNVFDTIIIGKELGVLPLSGVGSTGSINFLVIGFCNGVASGCAIPVAQSFGAKNYKEVRRYVCNIGYLGLVFSTILTLVACLFCKDILLWMKTLDEVYQYAFDYIFFIFLGIPVTFAYNVSSGIIRSLGDSKTPVIFLIIAIIINVGLDFLFIKGMHLGVKYAAIATNISQLIAAALCIIYMVTKFDILKMEKDDFKVSYSRIGKLLIMGLPMGLQYSITAIGTIILQGAVNGLNSTVYLASITAAGKMNNFFCTPFDALGGTMATFGGQNVGAKKYDRLKEGTTKACLVGIIYAIFALVFLYFFAGKMSLLFLEEPNEDIIFHTWQYVVITASFYILLVFVNVVRFMIQGMGYSFVAIIAGVLEMIGRIVVAVAIMPTIGYLGACFASPVAWVLADLFLIPTFIICNKKLMKKEEKNIKLATA